MNTLGREQAPILEDYYPLAPRLVAGQEVNERFIVDEQIGHGAQARVFGATDKMTGAAAALKVPSIANEDTLVRFIREAEVTSALSSESSDIVTVLDAGVSANYKHPFLFMAMENMPGETLEKRMQAVQLDPLTVVEVLRIVTPAFRGAAMAHDAELVHRDIKPDNIFITADRCGKLGDFGIVGMESFEPELLEMHHISPTVLSPVTGTNDRVGSPGSIAPEVVLRKTGHTKAADAFAAGVTLHYGMTGDHPVLGKRGGTFYEQMDAYRPPGPYLRGAVPKDVGKLTLSLLECDPLNRPTMREAVKVLEDASALYC